MYRYDDIAEVHLEVTSRCNAACPMCPRNHPGAFARDALPLTELRLEDITAIFQPDFVKGLRKVFLSGNYGDPLMGKDTLEICRYFRSHNPNLNLSIYTNGSGRKPEWWAELAKELTYCRFAIDGLADTNELYRRNTHWGTIIDNAQAFIAAGGRAEWDFIVFRHNEHQIEQAHEVSKTLGFAKFFVKRTNRFDRITSGEFGRMPVYDRDGGLSHYLEMPCETELHNEPMVQTIRLGKKLSERFDNAEIVCTATRQHGIYVSAEGLVFPCCYTGNIHKSDDIGDHEIVRMLRNSGQDVSAIDARKNGLRTVIEGAFFQRVLPESWHLPSVADGKPMVCARTCGKFAENMFVQSIVRRQVT